MKRKYTLPRIRKAFERYKQLSASQTFAMIHRGSQHGIAVADDKYAVEWQKCEFRMHVLDSWIRNDKINWFFARWISNEEAKKRNER